MTLTEAEIKSEARLAAIEYMLGHTLSRLYLILGVTDEQLDLMEANARDTLSKTTLPGANPALADMFAGEIQEHIERLSKITREMRDLTKGMIRE